MDRNQSIGFALLMMLFLGWYYVNAPTAEEIERQKFIQDSVEQARAKTLQENADETKIPQTQATPVSDSLKIAQLSNTYGALGSAMVGEGQEHILSNSLMDVSFNSKGGIVTKSVMKEHMQITEDENKVQTKTPLELLGTDKGKFEYILNTKTGGKISTQDLVYQTQKTENSIVFTANSGAGTIQHSYTLLPDSYTLDYTFSIDGVKQLLDPSEDKIRFRWHEHLKKLELNTVFEKFYSTIYFKPDDDNSDYCNCRSDDIEQDEDIKVEWMAHTNQFFNTSIISKTQNFTNTYFETVVFDDDNEYIKLAKGEGDLALADGDKSTFEFQMYLGPNEFERLVKFDNGIDEIIPFGRSIFGTINRYVIRPSFNFLSSLISSKGLVIILMIFIIKMLLYPLTYKMLHSQAKMGALKPELAKLTDKFKDDPSKKQMETMKIYREYGVSPLGGCMPMIVQMPIWYALFRFFPASITFRQESFLWATDLSSYDAFVNLPFDIPFLGSHLSLFTILWAVSTVIYTYYNTKHMDMSANPAMKYVQYAMPLMFLFFFNTYSSGLTCYMFFSNLFNIIQTVVTKKFVFNDEKILAELNKEKNKPKVVKKNSFQTRLEEAMKQQQEIQRKKQKRK